MSEFGRPNYDVPPWPLIDGIGELRTRLNSLQSSENRAELARSIVKKLDRLWQYHNQYMQVIGSCYTPAEPLDNKNNDFMPVSEISGLSLGFEVLNLSGTELTIAMMFDVGEANGMSTAKKWGMRLFGYVDVNEPFTFLQTEEEMRDPIEPTTDQPFGPDLQFAFSRYANVTEGYLARHPNPQEIYKQKALDYVRQRWPHGECELSVSAEYGYQIKVAEPIGVQNVHLFSRLQPIRGNLIDFGFFPRKISSNSSLTHGFLKLGADTLSLIIEPENPERFDLLPNRTLIVPTIQRVSAIIHEDNINLRVS